VLLLLLLLLHLLLLLLLLLLLQVVMVPNRGIWGTAGIGGANMDFHLHDSSSGPPQQVNLTCSCLLLRPLLACH
jgi:hypothetical protein